MKIHFQCLFVLLIAIAPIFIHSQTCPVESTFNGSPSNGFFGRATDIHGSLAIVGERSGDGLVNDSGVAYIYYLNGSGWNQVPIQASDGEAFDLFGNKVAVHGLKAVVGASWNDDLGSNSGSVYLYEFISGNWVETLLLASDGQQSDFFGNSVDIFEDRIVVGASGAEDPSGNSSGAIYVFDWDGSQWIESIIYPSGISHEIGVSVSVYKDRIVAGGIVQNSFMGSCYVFDYDGTTWQETAYLTPSDGVTGQWFGGNVALHEDRLAVGAQAHSAFGSSQGAAYVFDFDGVDWNEEQIFPSNPDDGHQFGVSVDLKGDYLMVGDIESVSGNAFYYQYDGTAWVETIFPQPTTTFDPKFGQSVSLDGDWILIGAPGFQSSQGQVHFYENCCDIEQVYYKDSDCDGYGNNNASIVACAPINGYVSNDLDCDDTDPLLNLSCNTCNGSVLVIPTITMNENIAEISISATAIVNQTNPVLFTAGQEITLDIGFEALTEFDAKIQTCEP